MSVRSAGAFLILASLSSSCAFQQKYRKPDGPLDQALFFSETDRKGEQRGISAKKADAKKVTRVAQPARIDLFSTIHVRVDEDQILSKEDRGFLESGTEELLAEKDVLVTALNALGGLVEAKRLAVEAYAKTIEIPLESLEGSPELVEFEEARREFSKAQRVSNETLRTLAGGDDSKLQEFQQIVLQDPSYGELQGEIQKRIDVLEARYRKIHEDASDRTLTLRMSAFLDAVEGDDDVPAAIHLAHYDLLNEDKVFPRDRFGLDLSERERTRLDKQMAASRELADAANRVRTGEEELLSAIQGVAPKISTKLAGLLTEVTEVSKLFTQEALDARLAKTETLVEQLLERARLEGNALEDDVKALVEQNVQAAKQQIQDQSTNLMTLVGAFDRAEQLRDDWGNVSPTTVFATYDASKSFVDDVRNALRNLPLDFGKAGSTLQAQADATVDEAQATAVSRAKAVLESQEAQALQAHFTELENDVRRVVALGQKLIQLPTNSSEAPMAVATHTPESFAVPLSDAKDTWIDLEQTPRITGDRIFLKATLSRGAEEVDSTTASFKITQYGWHGRLSPAVILAQPDQVQEGSDNFQFAPSVSWLLGYRPRAEETGAWAGFNRASELEFGLHSAFLNFDPEDELEVGLGATVSLWGGRLQGGVGYNLMADSTDDGGLYYFIGSDLIALLQDFGLSD